MIGKPMRVIGMIALVALFMAGCGLFPDAASVPVFSDDTLYQTSGTVITISTATEGATIVYTTDGSGPVESTSAVTGEIGSSTVTVTLDSDVVVTAIALVDRADPSPAISVTYEIVLFYDGFEDGTFDNWTVNPAADDETVVGVDSTLAANGTTASLHLDNTTTPGDYEDGAVWHTFSPGITPTYISYYVRYQENADTTGAGYAMAVICHDDLDTDVATEVFYTEFYTEGDGSDYLYETNDSANYRDTQRDTWYHVEYRNIVFTDGVSAGTFDYYLDGVEIGLAVEINGGSTTSGFSIMAITLGNDSIGVGEEQESWFDELVIK